MIPNVLKQLANSEKAVFVGLLVIAASALTALDFMSVAEWQDYTKWLAGIYVGGKAVEGAASSVAGAMKANPRTPTGEATANVAVSVGPPPPPAGSGG